MAELQNILSRLSRIFKSSEIEYVIVGGIAVNYYGHIRATQDIDIIIEDNLTKIYEFVALLETNNFDVMRDQLEIAIKEKTQISIFDNKSFLRLDLKVAAEASEYDALQNATKQMIFDNELHLASLEYVLIGKLMYMGRIENIQKSELLEYQDVIDFLTIYYANINLIDVELLEAKVKELNLEGNLERLLKLKFE
ncbi:MAG: hypothetical protein GF317_24020 [Candidatus Lokiarchaeota archaeon]|nr:hypothetical protein [Candidatus Lokiarchaeota archaeon]MBD3202440.1 hypothetical protein [Candidatus Lokiarchaeota archaeon]